MIPDKCAFSTEKQNIRITVQGVNDKPIVRRGRELRFPTVSYDITESYPGFPLKDFIEDIGKSCHN